MSLRKNPQIIGAIAFSALLAVLAVLSVFYLDDPWSVVGLVMLLAAALQLLNRVRKSLASYVEVDDTGVRGLTADGQKVEMTWDQIEISGVARDEKGFRSVFCYDPQADKYLQLPQMYDDFDTLIEVFTSQPAAQSWELSKGETIKSRLRSLVVKQDLEEPQYSQEAQDSVPDAQGVIQEPDE